MQTEVKEMEINGCHYHYYEGYLESILKEIETLGVNQQCSLHLCNFIYEYAFEFINHFIEIFVKTNLFCLINQCLFHERQETKKIFETVFVK